MVTPQEILMEWVGLRSVAAVWLSAVKFEAGRPVYTHEAVEFESPQVAIRCAAHSEIG